MANLRALWNIRSQLMNLRRLNTSNFTKVLTMCAICICLFWTDSLLDIPRIVRTPSVSCREDATFPFASSRIQSDASSLRAAWWSLCCHGPPLSLKSSPSRLRGSKKPRRENCQLPLSGLPPLLSLSARSIVASSYCSSSSLEASSSDVDVYTSSDKVDFWLPRLVLFAWEESVWWLGQFFLMLLPLSHQQIFAFLSHSCLPYCRCLLHFQHYFSSFSHLLLALVTNCFCEISCCSASSRGCSVC